MDELLKMKQIYSAIALSLGVTFAAQAAVPAENSNLPGELPAALALATQGGMSVENRFDAEGGLTGWLLKSSNGSYAIAYTPANGEVVLAGSLISAKGEDLTKKYLSMYGNYDKFLPRLEQTETINAGAKGDAVKSTIYAFLDTNCIFCHYLHKALKPYQEAGLEVKWVPVAILGGNSPGQAAALLEAKDPAAALEEHEATWSPKDDNPGIAPVALSQKRKAQLDANVQLMQDMGGNGTPLIVYKDSRGHWQKASGMPRLGDLPEITGLPEQKIEDPALNRFR